jgi:hypothetical protein
MPCGALQDSTSCHNSGIANRLDVVLADGRLGTTRGRVAAEDSWVEFGSRRLLKGMSHKCLLLFSRQELERARDRVQKQVGIVQVGSREEIRADHLQTITPRFVSSQHESCGLDRLLNHRDLTLVQLEVDDFPGFGFSPGQLLLDLPFELLLR